MRCFIVLLALVAVSLVESAIPANSPIQPLGFTIDDDVLDNDEIGDERIISGQTARQNQFPYQAALRILRDGRISYCGGVLLSNRWVLSTAHCTRPFSQLTLRLGSVHLGSGGIMRAASHVYAHPSFHSESISFDIALIHLPTPLANVAGVRAVRLPRATQPSTFTGVLATVSGWGAVQNGGGLQNTLRWANVRVISNADCADKYEVPGTILSSMICTRGSNGVQGICTGDSGGPLTTMEGSASTLIGIASFVPANDRGACTGGLPHGYTRVTSFLGWINAKTNIPLR